MALRLRPSASAHLQSAIARSIAGVVGGALGAVAGLGLVSRCVEPRWGDPLAWLVVGAYGSFGACSAVLAQIDLRERRLPNAWLLAATGLTGGLLCLASALGGGISVLWVPLGLAVLCGGLGVGTWVLARVTLGGGDVKLLPIAVFVSVWAWEYASHCEGTPSAGWQTGLLLFLLVLSGATAIAAIIGMTRKSRSIPAGPIMLGAAWVAIGAATL